MKRIEKAFSVFKGEARCQIIDDHCPYEINSTLEDYDINTYQFSGYGVDRGCRGITCEECWEKPIN